MSQVKISEIPTVFEDQDLLLVNKPVGLVSTSPSVDSPGALELLLPRHRKLILMHRLDRDTSGLLLFAKRQPTAALLSQAFEKRLVRKTYLAVVEGEWPKNQARIESRIARGENGSMVESPQGKAALTLFRVLLKGEERTLIEARPKTGRTHQIRVHCASAGHAILGDRRYGGDQQWPAQALHSFCLEFRHPATGESLSLKAPLEPLRRYGVDWREVNGKLAFRWGSVDVD